MIQEIILQLLQGAYVLIPAYLANMAPPLAKKLRFMEPLARPLDHGRTFKNKPVFGHNKTYRGFIVGMIAGALGGILMTLLRDVKFFEALAIQGLPYENLVFMICFGALMGFGALLGDLLESFIKRRLGIGPGQKFIPWDQIDLVLGSYVVILPLIFSLLSWKLFLASIIMTFCLHVITNHIAYFFNIRKERW